ncbi:MAG TPA: alpha/beta hydrolase [Candidatus Dormibacteraeota bacterium]
MRLMRWGTVSLPGGRRLGYAECGDLEGHPVLYLHGVPGTRIARVGSAAEYRKRGLRLVTVDRPGCGVSTLGAPRRLLDWPEDVAALMGALGISRFSILAQSGGAPFALACAYRMPDRITSLVISSGAGPLYLPGARRGMKPLNRLALRLLGARRLSFAVWAALRGAFAVAPDLVIDYVLCLGSPPADAVLLARPDIKRLSRRMLRLAIRNGISGVVEEMRVVAGPWGFDPEQVPIRARFWHGDQDNTVPVAHAAYLASAIRGSSLIVCPGEGHMVMWRHLDEMLDALAADAYAERLETTA